MTLNPWQTCGNRIEKNCRNNLTGKSVAKTFSLAFVLRVAALVIFVMGACFAVYLRNEKTWSSR